ncbi:MAG: vanadium-dependent haloperoxidase [Verrucomicrobiota bacterium]|nr:vanadium-dependent haloperoxidase [Verrucomicrobiota bacterium]
MCRGEWDPYNNPSSTAAELALASLRLGRRQLADEHLQRLLHGKFDNPILGLLGAHMLLDRKQPSLALFREVLGNLQSLLGAHPDVAALRSLARRHFAEGLPPESASVPKFPPMLRAGVTVALDAEWEDGAPARFGPLDSLARFQLSPDEPWTFFWQAAAVDTVPENEPVDRGGEATRAGRPIGEWMTGVFAPIVRPLVEKATESLSPNLLSLMRSGDEESANSTSVDKTVLDQRLRAFLQQLIKTKGIGAIRQLKPEHLRWTGLSPPSSAELIRKLERVFESPSVVLPRELGSFPYCPEPADQSSIEPKKFLPVMSQFYPRPHPNSAQPGMAAHDLKNATADGLELHYHKGLEHDAAGRVVPAKFEKLRHALDKHSPQDFRDIELTGSVAGKPSRRLINPQAGLAADRETAEGFRFRLPKPPEQAGKKDTAAAEMIELYWMALLRDVPFSEFGNAGNDTNAAAAELSGLKLYAKPDSSANPVYETHTVTAKTLFRGGDWWAGSPEHKGPYISQFLHLDVPFGTLKFDQREKQAADGDYRIGGTPYLIEFAKWKDAQDGADLAKDPVPVTGGTYIRNMGDLARYVHIDQLYEAYLNAALILLGAKAPLDPGNPYGTACDTYGQGLPMTAGHCSFMNEIGFGTFGGPHVLSLVCEVATRALKAVWYQKWVANLRLRPEAYAGLAHRALFPGAPSSAAAQAALGAGLSVLQSSNSSGGAVARIRAANAAVSSASDTYLLPMCFPEGSPTHPAYGAGHATVAGACVTVLKAFFKEEKKLSELGFPIREADAAGNLQPYTGTDANDLTVGGELDKVASNIAIGRNMAGVHWRTDYTQSVLLGQRLATSMLYHQLRDYHERPCSFTFKTFGGNTVEIVFAPDANPAKHREGIYYNGAPLMGEPDHCDPTARATEATKLQQIV